MKLRWLTIAVVLAVCMGAAAQTQTPPLSAAELMNQVVANELADRVEQRKWIYQVSRRDGTRTLSEPQVDTKDGPLYRLLAIDGAPLNPHSGSRTTRASSAFCVIPASS